MSEYERYSGSTASCILMGLMEPLDLLVTFVTAMTPVGELRLAIPLAIYTYDVTWYVALPIAVVGNMVPVLVLVPGLSRLSRFLLSFPNPAGRLLTWQEDRLRRVQSRRFERYGALALVILVAIPLPMTGAWTGSLAAWTFRIPPRRAIPLIALGVLIAGLIVTVATLSGIKLGGIILAE
ncbi:MAG: small multi-drug export protein [Chloroflexota bacterium]